MLSPSLEAAMNEHIGAEMYSAQLYLSMSAYCETINLQGFANWLRVQYQEETAHALKFYRYVLDRGNKVVLQAIPAPPSSFHSVVEVFEETLTHEQEVSRRINELYGLAVKEGDYASQAFLNWFVTEQVEEEKRAKEILETLRMIGDSNAALIVLDQQMGQRTPAPVPQ